MIDRAQTMIPASIPAIRSARESDFPAIAHAVQTWWTVPGYDAEAASRERAALLPRLWLQHFADTSFVAEREGKLVGFQIGRAHV